MRATGLLLLILTLSAAAQEVEVRDGVITNVPAHPRLYVPSPAALAGMSANEAFYTPLLEAAAQRTGLDPLLVKAVVRVESAFYPQAYSSSGAMGLMQLMPATARELGVGDPWDPAANVDGGCRYLRRMLDQFGSLELALAAYNAGPQAVEFYGAIPPYAETQKYVVLVLDHFHNYGGSSTSVTASLSGSSVPADSGASSSQLYIRPDGTITNIPPQP